MISKLEIINFRSIKNLIIEPERLWALIGANSVGKTNILKAIDLVLGERWVTKAKVATELFYNIKEPPSIEIYFNLPEECLYIDRYGQNQKILLILLNYK